MDNFLKARMGWNWSHEDAPKDGSRFLAFIPKSKPDNRVQRVRWDEHRISYYGGGVNQGHFVNDHGNIVEFEAFYHWPDPAQEQEAFDVEPEKSLNVNAAFLLGVVFSAVFFSVAQLVT